MTTSVLRATPILAFEVTVTRVERLSPTYLRLTFGGAALADFADGGELGPRDLRIKLIVPPAGGVTRPLTDTSDGWYPRWLALDPVRRGVMRTYTVRAARIDRVHPEIDVDVVLHLDGAGRGGPATTWAANARVGDPITILGPDARAGSPVGIEWRPPTATPGAPVRVLLAGDETAVPAVGNILASLPPGHRGHAVLEVPRHEDFQDLPTTADVEIRWLARGARARGTLLAATVRSLVGPSVTPTDELPEVDVDTELLWETATHPGAGEVYAWIAGEAGVVRELRRHLVRDCGIDRSSVTFMGYWRDWRDGRAQLA